MIIENILFTLMHFSKFIFLEEWVYFLTKINSLVI